ncbi:hypothetical protein N0V88_007660 [Collariella sp. IMI 366227]|nr:hypothetical protein N0V88_007660 [Collariella sp. IMI 366227]
MVDITRAQPHVIRVAIMAITLLLIFLFFDPIGFASSSMAEKKPGTSRSITHLVMLQFKHGADPATIDAHGLTHAFIVNFATQADRNYYVEHDPVHQAFKKEINGIVEKVTVLDFTNGKF